MSVPSSKNTVVPNTMNTPVAVAIPDGVDKDPKNWKRADVFAYLKANQEKYGLDDEDIDVIRKNKVSGLDFLELTKGELLQSPYGLSGGAATIIEELSKELGARGKRQLLTDTDYPSKALRLVEPSRYWPWMDSCWHWWQYVHKMEIEKTMTFPMAILGSEHYGSMIYVRDAYKLLCNKIIWNKTISDEDEGLSDEDEELSDEDEELSDEVAQDKIMGKLGTIGTNSRDSYIVTGTPGIGKTFFGFYLICRYVKEYPNSDIIWEDGNLTVALRSDGGISWRVPGQPMASIGPSGEVSNREDMSFNEETLYIVDGMKPAMGAYQPFVLLTSPKHERFKDLEKASGVHMLGMPVWCKTELEQLWKLKFSSSTTESAWKDRFDKWGGVPRSVLDKTDNWYQQELEDNIRKLNLEACMYSVGSLNYNSDQASGTIIHTMVTREGGYEDFQMAFASLYVENKVISHYKQWITQKLIATAGDGS